MSQMYAVPSIGENGEAAATGRFSYQSVLGALRCWWKVATPIGLFLAAASGLAMICFSQPEYTAATWIQIRERPESLLPHASNEDPRKYVQNQLELIKSPLVLEPIAAIPAVASTPELMNEGDPVYALRSRLKVKAMGQSDYFVIQFTSVSPAKAALVVNEVAKAFFDLQQRSESKRLTRTIELLEKQQTGQEAVVKMYRDRLQVTTKELTGKDPFAANTQAEANKIELHSQLASLQTRLVDEEVHKVFLTAELQAAKELLEQSFEPSKHEVDRYVHSQSAVAQLENDIEAIKEKVKDHEKTSANLKQNAAYIHLKKQLEDKESSLTRLTEQLQVRVKEDLQKAARAEQEKEVASLEQQLATSDFTLQFLREKLDAELKNQKEYKGESLQLEFTRAEYERSGKIHEKISERLTHLRMEREIPGRVEIFKVATAPVNADEAIPYKKVGMGGGAAFLLPFLLAVAFESLYRRVGSRQQLEAIGKLTVVAEVPLLPTRVRKRSSEGHLNRELQLFEESIDGLRTYLSVVDSLQGISVLAVNSAVSGEGKTSLASQLAVSIASATGQPTLLIDGDLRSPDLHRIFDIENAPGLAEVLNGKASVEDAIETGFSDVLHLLPAGSLSTSPHRLLSNGEFTNLVVGLRAKYRYIIIDTPPILPASESLLISRAADAAVLCVRRDFSRVDQVEDARHKLEAAGIRTAGTVLNGIPASLYARRYGSYYYNRTRLSVPVSRN